MSLRFGMTMIISVLLGCICFLLAYFFVYKKSYNIFDTNERTERIDKILTILFFILALVELLTPDLWSDDNWEDFYQNGVAPAQPLFSIARLLDVSMVVTIPIALSFGRKLFSRYVAFVGPIDVLLNCLLYRMYYESALNAYDFFFGKDSFISTVPFHVTLYIAIELLKIMLIMRVYSKRGIDLKFDGRKDVAKTFVLFVPLMFVGMPPAFPGMFFGNKTDILLQMGNLCDILWLVWIVVEVILLTIIAKKWSAQDRYILLVVLSIALLLQYSVFFRRCSEFWVRRLPLQLCNAAVFLIFFAVIGKNRGLAIMVSTVNLFGALIAIAICDTASSPYIFDALVVHYMVAHTKIVIVSVLMLTLGYITPLKKSDLKSLWKWFTLYFVSVLVIGTTFMFFYNKSGGLDDRFKCNYLFIYDREYIEELVSPLAVLFDYGINIGKYIRFTAFQLFMYISVLGVGSGLFFLWKALFKRNDLSMKIAK